MLNITAEEKKALKGRGIIMTNDGEHFIARIVSPCGLFTNEQMQAVTDAAKKYGNGDVAMTTRLTMEIQGVPYGVADELIKDMEAVNLWVGGTGSVVRPIVACKGTVCIHGLMDTQKFADKLFHEFYVGWHGVKLPHKFKIGIGGCPNNCVKPAYHDFGIMGQSVPEYDSDLCNACKKCSVIEHCLVGAVHQDDDGQLVLDHDKCTNCGKCIGQCNFDSIEEAKHGYRVFIGGIWGKTQRNGTAVPGIYSEDEIEKLIEKAILLYREQGKTGERFGRTIDRIGVDNFIAQLLSDDVLERKQEILDAKLHLGGGATC